MSHIYLNNKVSLIFNALYSLGRICGDFVLLIMQDVIVSSQ